MRELASDPTSAGQGWSRCPGCGVSLPSADGPSDLRRNASAACWMTYGEVAGLELRHVAELGRFHQLMVDAYGAQHGGPRTSAISNAFGLIGLHLALDRGWTGLEVREAHQNLARRFREWPRFDRPAQQAELTVLDVALADSIDAHADLVGRWARAVWSSWQAAHPRVIALVDERLPGDHHPR